MQNFNTYRLSSIQDKENIVFIQSDNGQIDNKSVIAYLRRNGVYIRYTHPYHSNMNYFIERSVWSIKDLARYIITPARVSNSYWDKAVSHTWLIRNIIPNVTSNGYTREAYYKWYGLVFDYSRLRT